MNKISYFIKVSLLVYSSFWFVFSLLSGAEEYGGGLRGIVMNSPNSLPWIFLFGLVYLSWKKEIIGGFLIFLMGIGTVLFFKTFQDIVVFSIVSLPLLLLGGGLVLNQYLIKKE